MKKQFYKYLVIIPFALLTALLGSCSSDDDNTIPEEKEEYANTAELTNIEIGLNNNELGTIGKDFHFNMDILAKGKIDNVKVELKQIEGETYAKPYSYEVVWDYYKGMKNANVHIHFDIPTDAAEGKYEFIITVYDENGDVTVEKRHLKVFLAENLPVNPELYAFNVFVNDKVYYSTHKDYEMPDYIFKKDDKLEAICRLSGVKGDGKMYIILVKRKLNHKPETIQAIDFSKAIVYTTFEHKDIANVGEIVSPIGANLKALSFGAAQDYNLPTPNAIDAQKAWESGDYYLGVVYTNTTYNISYFNYIDLKVNY